MEQCEASKNYDYEILQDLNDLYKDRKWTDVKFKVEDRIFEAHKCIVGQRSEFFKVMFSETYSEKDQDAIELKDINAFTFETLLALIYGALNFDNTDLDRVINILQIPKYFINDDLTALASEVLAKRIVNKNALRIFEIASYHSLENLTFSCMIFITRNSYELIYFKHYLHLSPKVFKEFISLDCLYVSEIEIFRAVKKWLEVNPDADSKQEIVNQVRLNRISDDDFLEIQQSKLFKEPTRLFLQRGNSERGKLIVNVNLYERSEVRKMFYSVRSRKFSKFFRGHETEFVKMQHLEVMLGTFYFVNTILLETQPGPYKVVVKCCYSDKEIIPSDMRYDELLDMECISLNKYRVNLPSKVVKYIGIVGLQKTDGTFIDLQNIEILYST